LLSAAATLTLLASFNMGRWCVSEPPAASMVLLSMLSLSLSLCEWSPLLCCLLLLPLPFWLLSIWVVGVSEPPAASMVPLSMLSLSLSLCEWSPLLCCLLLLPLPFWFLSIWVVGAACCCCRLLIGADCPLKDQCARPAPDYLPVIMITYL
jgi:hypothetical protein